ncbi:hypothetical protein Esti_005097 [Eimeria stiedai]
MREDECVRFDRGRAAVFGGLPSGFLSSFYASAVAYPCGRVMVLHKLEAKTQRFLQGADEALEIVCAAVSHNKRYLLLGERSERRALVSIYDLISMKVKKSLAFAECESKEFRSVAFSGDSRFLLALGGPPDWCLVYWAWEKAKVVTSYKLFAPSLDFCECSYNPLDSSIVCLIGDGVSRMLRLQDGQLRLMQNYLSKRQGQCFTSHAWLSDDSLVVASHNGDLTLLDGTGDLVASLSCSPGVADVLRCVVPTSTGFVCGGAGASIRLYEKSQDPKEIYELTTDVIIDNKDAEGAVVSGLAVSPKDDAVAVSLSNGQLFHLSLKNKAEPSNPQTLKPSEPQTPATPALSFLHTSFHIGAILGVDVCVQKPWAVTCGEDQTIRVWDYLERRLELSQQFSKEILSVAFHPSSYHVLAGFTDKLRLMNLMLGELRTVKEFGVKASRECRFSHGGHMFAAANGNVIEVFCMHSSKHHVTLRGHTSRVVSLCWSLDDNSIASAGADGAIYEFSIHKDGTRVQDWVQKSVQFHSIALSPLKTDAETSELYAVGSDACIKQIQQSQLAACFETGENQGAIAALESGRAFFTGSAVPGMPGPIRCYKAPLTGEFGKYPCHARPVTRLAVAAHDFILLSAGQDGVLCVWNVNDRDRAPLEHSGLEYTAEVLVDRAHLLEKQSQLIELERQVEDITNEMVFQKRMFEAQHRDAMNQLEVRFNKELTAERNKFDILREEKLEEERVFQEKIDEQEQRHAASVQALEAKFQSKLSVELNRQKKLVQEKEKERQSWEQQKEQLLKEAASKEEGTWNRSLALQAKRAQEELQRLQEKKDLALKTHQELLQQVEEDADRQVSLKEMYERRLADQNAEKVKLRGQAGVFRQRFEDAKEQAEQFREAARTKEERAARLKADVDKLLADRATLNHELQERDRTIGEKEQRIYDLKKKNQELEKFRFVLDYKVKQLKAMIDPKTRDVREMQSQIQAMDAELVEYHRQGKLSAMELGQLKLKHKALREQISSQRQEIARGKQRMRRLHLDIYACMQHLQDPKKLKAGVTALYRKHLSKELRPAEVDTDILKEQTRQRDYLEKAVECLKKRLGKDSETHRQDNVKLMQENAALICEINDLRKEVFTLHSESQQFKLTRGSKRPRDTKQGKGGKGGKDGGPPLAPSASGVGERPTAAVNV